MPLDIQRRNSIAQQRKDPAPEEPRRSTSRDQGPGGSRRSAAQQLPAWGIATVRERKWILAGGEAQLRRDAVIGASATRVHPWWRGAIDSGQGNARRVIRLASHDPAHVRYSNAHGKKKGLHPKFVAWCPRRLVRHGRFTEC